MRVVLASLLVLASPLAAAQGRWLDTFAVPGPDLDVGSGQVRVARTDGDGVLVGGQFQRIGTVDANGLVRWTGAGWEAVGRGFRTAQGEPATVTALVRDAAGDLWAAGDLAEAIQADGSTTLLRGIARWRGGRWEAVGGVADPYERFGALALYGGAVVVGGAFDAMIQPGGTPVQTGGVARWTGARWEGLGRAPTTYALAVLPSGDLVAGGAGVPFRSADGSPVAGSDALARWDGAAWRALGNGLADARRVSALAVWNGALYVGGSFEGGTDATGAAVPSPSVARWDGAAWQPVGGGIPSSAYGLVYALSADGGRGVLVGGAFGSVRAGDGTRVASPGVARWTGTAWEPVPFGAVAYPFVLALASDGERTVVGGAFVTESGAFVTESGAFVTESGAFVTESGAGAETTRAQGLVARASAGAPFRPVGGTGRDGLSGYASTVATAACGRLWVSGPQATPSPYIQTYGTTGEAAVAAWDGAAWVALPAGLRGRPLRPAEPAGYVSVQALAPVPGACDAVVVGGLFGGTVGPGGTVTSPYIVRWDGQAWQPLGRGTNGPVNAAAFGADGALYVAGAFTEAVQSSGAVVAARGVARWTEAGGWAPLGGGLTRDGSPGYGFTVRPQPDGSVLVGGQFDRVVERDGTGRAAASVARWTGTAWQTFGGIADPTYANRSVAAVAVWNGEVVVGGAFDAVVGPDGTRTEALNTAVWNGTAWRALPGDFLTSPGVFALEAVGPDLYAAGSFLGGVVRWGGAAWQTLGTGVDGVGGGNGPAALAATAERLYVAGPFGTAGGISSPGLAAYDLDGLVATEPALPAAPGALRAYPNPSRTSATLAFHLDAPGRVRLVLLDALGRTVAVLLDGEAAAGEQTLRADVSGLPAGVYVARLAAGGTVRTQRLTVVR